MSIRTWLTLPTLGLLAVACGDDGAATSTDTDSGTTGDTAEESSSGGSVSATMTATSADSSGTTTDEPTTTAPGESSSSTGEPVLCGNGDLDDGEECDDENTIDGDTCTATCTIPYEVVWMDSHNGSASNQDTIAEIAVDGAGNIYVVGSERVTGEGSNIWLAQYAVDGTPGWSVSYNGLFNADDSGAALALLADGDIVVAGSSEGEFDGEDIFAVRVDGTTQMVEWEIIQDGPGMGPGKNDDADFASDVTVDAAGNIYIAGSVRVGPQDWDMWVGKYDDAGAETWTATYAGAEGAGDFGRAVVVDADSNVWLLGNEEDAMGEAIGTVLGYDVDGMEIAGMTQVLDFRASDMAADADGNVVIIGDGEPGDTFFDIIVRKYDPAWAETWSVVLDAAGSDEFSGGVSVGPSGNIYATGTTRIDAAQYDAFLRVLGADGTSLLGAHYGNTEAMLDDQFNYAVEHPDGDAVAGGFESVLGEQRNGLLVKYHAL